MSFLALKFFLWNRLYLSLQNVQLLANLLLLFAEENYETSTYSDWLSGAMIFSIMKLSIMIDTENNETQHNDTQHNDIPHNDTPHNNTKHNITQHNDTPHNDTPH